jgi:peptide/nickel transport system substrate-binding protein
MARSRVRQAVQTAIGPGEMLAAGFGDTRFFIVEGNHFPKGTPFYSDRRHRGTTTSATADEGQGHQADQAGYKGEPVRILTSRQYDFHYNMALVMAEQLKRAGFKAELRRGRVGHAAATPRRPEAVGHLHHALGPVPRADALAAATGRRRARLVELRPAKKAALAALNQEPDPAKRGALWGKVQQVVYDEVPYIHVGKFASLSASFASAAQGYTPITSPFFWNTEPEELRRLRCQRPGSCAAP